MHIRQLYFNFTATANAAAFIEIPRKCKLKQISWAIRADMAATGDYYVIEASLVPYAQNTQNDAMGVLSTVQARCNLITAAGTAENCALNMFVPQDCDLEAGQRIYLNGELNSVSPVNVICLLTCTG